MSRPRSKCDQVPNSIQPVLCSQLPGLILRHSTPSENVYVRARMYTKPHIPLKRPPRDLYGQALHLLCSIAQWGRTVPHTLSCGGGSRFDELLNCYGSFTLRTLRTTSCPPYLITCNGTERQFTRRPSPQPRHGCTVAQLALAAHND